VAKGRPPKSREEREQAGNPGKRPLPAKLPLGEKMEVVDVDDDGNVTVLNDGRLEPLLDALPYPSHLPADGREWWELVVPALVRARLLRSIFVPGLELMVDQWVTIKRSQQVLDEFGYFSRGSTGQWTKHPAMEVKQAAIAEYRRLGDEFGLTPSGLARLGLTGKQIQRLGQLLDETLPPRG
jgi:P27 family predicted phage terminase small subunit